MKKESLVALAQEKDAVLKDIKDCAVKKFGALERMSPQGFSNAQNSRLIEPNLTKPNLT